VLALAGMVLGVVGAVVLSGSLRSQLYDVSPVDPISYIVAAVALAVAALFAGFLPARRSSRVNPVEALRAE
jgi:ABC-type antimicrobial peptide transport system permease subunit